MAITTTTILDRVETTLLDTGNTAWTRAELLDYLNAMIRLVCLIKVDANVVTEAVSITTSETKQTIPAAGYQFLRVVRNMGSGGSTIGNVVRKIEMNTLDRFDPTWQTATGSAVEHYMFDPRNPKQYWIYPRVTSTHFLEIEYAAIPDDVDEGDNDAIPIKDIYETPLYWGVLAHAFAKNAKRGDLQKHNYYVDLLTDALGSKQRVQAAFNPQPEESNTDGD